MRNKRLDECAPEIIAGYQSRRSSYELADEYGVDASTIRERLREWGITIRTGADYRPGGPLCMGGGGARYLTTYARDKQQYPIHRGCWEAHYGPVPEDRLIHHADHNPLNNAIENLECMTQSEHQIHHKATA